MSKHALFLQHRTKPGARDAVQQVWKKHMQIATMRLAAVPTGVAAAPSATAPIFSPTAPGTARRLRRSPNAYATSGQRESGETADPGDDAHGAPDPMPLWTILDLTPGGRGTAWYPKLDYAR
jgi:predicted dithiol-disulfide oxidoreductase (DUF899 family)